MAEGQPPAPAALNVSLNLALVPFVGPRGPAAAFVASESLVLLLARRAFRRRVLDEPRLPGLGAGLAGAAVAAFVLVAASGLTSPVRLAVAAGACGAAVVAVSGPSAIRSAWVRLFDHS